MMNIVFYVITGIVTGLVAGVLGVGGGLIVVPALDLFLAHIVPESVVMRMAAGTSLAIMIPTSFSACLSHHFQKNVLWSVWKRLAPGILLGVFTGATLAHYLPSNWLRIGFGLFTLSIAFRLFMLVQPKAERHLPGFLGLSSVGFAIGAKSGLLGLGGGALSVPFLVRCNVSMHQARGTSSAISFLIAILGTLAFMFHGAPHTTLVAGSSGYIYWPAVMAIAPTTLIVAPISAHLGSRLPVNLLKRIFATCLVAIAINMFWLA